MISEIAGSAVTGVVIKQLFADLTTMINKARDDADYLLARAGVEAKDALDLWQKVNGSLLDKAFSELDKASRENFARAHQLLAAANTGAADRLETIREITVNANQIVESIPLGGKQTYILRFSPRIMPPQSKEAFVLRIQGVNLHKGDPQLHLKSGLAKRDQPGPLEAQFTIPLTEVQVDDQRLQINSFKLTHTTPSNSWIARLFGWLFGWRDDVSRELPIVVLPKVLGTYELSGSLKVEKRVEKAFNRDLGKFEGTNTDVYKVATPEDGWRWDLSKPLNSQQGNGESGSCAGPDMNQSSEHGITFRAHCDKITNSSYPFGRAGWVNCGLSGTIYRIEAGTEALQPQTGVLTWTSDVEISLPTNTDSISLKIKTFDGRERIITGTDSDQFFDIRREPQVLIITPKVPQDIGAR